MTKTAVVLMAVLAGSAFALPVHAEDSMPDAMRTIAGKVLAEKIDSDATKKRLDVAGVKPGAWYRIGPFRDQGPLLNWMENVDASYKHVFDVEKDTLAAGGQSQLDKKYPAPNFPATPDAVQSWTEQPDWIDGFYQELPRGPAPSAGETQYVYREITADEPIEVEIDCILRAPESDRRMGDYGMEPWRRTGRYTWWVNG
ncbi:MAG: hypothetical protein HQ567_17515, partial [Candidatus Nealsonbacteria bacterium]|nr:hypothetical protein [Candidatus Nealsonbacteria bacterium]